MQRIFYNFTYHNFNLGNITLFCADLSFTVSFSGIDIRWLLLPGRCCVTFIVLNSFGKQEWWWLKLFWENMLQRKDKPNSNKFYKEKCYLAFPIICIFKLVSFYDMISLSFVEKSWTFHHHWLFLLLVIIIYTRQEKGGKFSEYKPHLKHIHVNTTKLWNSVVIT